MDLSLVVASGGYSPVAVHGLLIAVFFYFGAPDLECAGFSSCACGLSSFGSQALEHRRNNCGATGFVPPRLLIFPQDPESIESVSPALTGRFFTTEPSGSPQLYFLSLF